MYTFDRSGVLGISSRKYRTPIAFKARRGKVLGDRNNDQLAVVGNESQYLGRSENFATFCLRWIIASLCCATLTYRDPPCD